MDVDIYVYQTRQCQILEHFLHITSVRMSNAAQGVSVCLDQYHVP